MSFIKTELFHLKVELTTATSLTAAACHVCGGFMAGRTVTLRHLMSRSLVPICTYRCEVLCVRECRVQRCFILR